MKIFSLRSCTAAILAFLAPALAAQTAQDSLPIFTQAESLEFPASLFSVVRLKDGQHAVASLSSATIDGITTAPRAVLAILSNESGSWQIQRYIAVNQTNGSGVAAYGLTLTPDESILAVALNNKGIGLLRVEDLLNGQAVPAYVALWSGTGSGPGSIAIAAAPDNTHVFVADEYGRSQDADGIGDIAVVRILRDDNGQLSGGQRLGYFKPGDSTIASLAIAPDGKTLYIPSQLSNQEKFNHLAGKDNATIGKQCTENAYGYSGTITAVDVDQLIEKANTNPGDGNRVLSDVEFTQVAAGCNPVRIAISSDSSKLWTSARGENLIHAFDTSRLRSDPDNAHLYSFPSNGDAPVGVAVFGNDQFLAVNNSDRFDAGNGLRNTSVFDISADSQATLAATIESGLFPRDIYVSPSQQSFLSINFNSNTFQEVRLARLQLSDLPQQVGTSADRISYAATLSSEPLGTATVSFSASTGITPDSTEQAFDATNWQQSRRITATLAEGTTEGEIAHTVSTTGVTYHPEYDGNSANHTLTRQPVEETTPSPSTETPNQSGGGTMALPLLGLLALAGRRRVVVPRANILIT